MNPTTDRENLWTFVSTLKSAVEQARATGQLETIPQENVTQFVSACDKPVMQDHNGRPIFLHRIWRLRVARMYWQENGRDSDEKPWNIDWEAIWNWVVENIVPIMKALLPMLLFLI